MMRKILPILALVAITGCDQAPEGEAIVRAEIGDAKPKAETVPTPEPTPTEPAVPSACSTVVFEKIPLSHCIANPSEHRITTAYAQASGDRFGSLAAFAETVDKRTIAFAINGGPAGDDGKPKGYFVQNKQRIAELDLGSGDGNFYIKPNGVFYGTGNAWRLRTTPSFYSGVRDRPQFGTQSGPMLLVDGKLPSEISENGPSRAIRSGVGIGSDGKAHFVVSQKPLSFGQLARFFRDEAKVKNALFLASNRSALWDPATKRLDNGSVGPIIVVTKREVPSE